jgi:hypothetical protein
MVMREAMKKSTNRWMGAVGTALIAGAAGWFLGTWAGIGLAHGKELPGRNAKVSMPVDDMFRESPEYFEFSEVQKNCVRSRFTPFGKAERWKSCRLEHTGFVGTIAVPGAGLQDFYYANYCLIRSGHRCDQQALLIFSNRAYRSEAVLRLARLDPAGTRYKVPLMIGTEMESALAITVQAPGGTAPMPQYFGWRNSRWVGIEPGDWAKQLAVKLPEGLAARIPAGAMPDPESLEMRLPLYRVGSEPCCGSLSANVHFAIEGGALAISSVAVANERESN